MTLAALTGADRTTPIVLVAVDFDPVTTGDVNSLARPGGRVTGITALQSVLPAKRLELLKEMLPAARKVAVFSNDQTQVQLTPTQGTARRLGIDLQVIDFKKPPFDYKAGFAEAKRAKAEALVRAGLGALGAGPAQDHRHGGGRRACRRSFTRHSGSTSAA